MSQQPIKTNEIRIFFQSSFTKAGYSKERISKFCKTAERLHAYMIAQNEDYYTAEIGETFLQLEHVMGQMGNGILKTDRRAIGVINMILAGEPIIIRPRTTIKTYPGEIGEASLKCLHYLDTEVRLKESSLNRYATVLSPFSHYCHLNGISIQELDYCKIMGYMSSRQNVDSKTSSVLRTFLRYLYETDLIRKDYSRQIAHIRPRSREKIPSFYSKEEILQIEGCIERSYPLGKRNYAIVKLASRLGLRASDISTLEFSHIEWERNIIRLKQKKTGKIIELPLLADVGNAIIDYIQNGRPQVRSKAVFISYSTPHRPITSAAISTVVSCCIKAAGINVDGRRHGAHSLRHSLAYNMLNSGSPLGTISSALGHTGVESTMRYMGIGLKELMNCSLEVSPVDAAFYNQGGGLLYD